MRSLLLECKRQWRGSPHGKNRRDYRYRNVTRYCGVRNAPISTALMTILEYFKIVRLLSNVWLGMMVLSYTVLFAALALYLAVDSRLTIALNFTDNGRLYIVPLFIAGVALSVGSFIIRKMSDRWMEQANPMRRLMRLRYEAEQRPKPLVNVCIRSVPDAECRYTITVYNGSPDMLIDASLDHSWFLHPGKFGLDDTHMPDGIWKQPPISF
jgi:hypothetical protein